MLQESTTSYLFLFVAFGQLLLATSIILPRLKRTAIYTPLVMFFITSGIVFTAPAINSIWPTLTYYSLFIVLPLISLQPVSLWLYVKGLTSPTPWQLTRNEWRHFILSASSIVVCIYMLAMPKAALISIFVAGQQPTSNEGITLVLVLLTLFILYVIQTTYYVFSTIARLLRYHHNLQMIFSSNDKRELVWVYWLVALFSLTWLLAALHIIPFLINNAPLVSSDYIAGSYFFMIWSICLWGIRQKPGFHKFYQQDKAGLQRTDNIELSALVSDSKEKYQRSALGEKQAHSIQTKLEQAMSNEQLYLNANLSLPELAKHLVVPANYLSQTLNQFIGDSFFDYINQWRIKHAIELLQKGKLTVIEIAMASGFNAKSSFYKAFKKHTGTTPGNYHKLTT